jgi:hypothetical protein
MLRLTKLINSYSINEEQIIGVNNNIFTQTEKMILSFVQPAIVATAIYISQLLTPGILLLSPQQQTVS